MSTCIEALALHGSPQEIYARLHPDCTTALLESAKLMPGLSGWSYIAGPALAVLETGQAHTTLSGQALPTETWAAPFDALRSMLARLAALPGLDPASPNRPAGLAFAGGLIGHLGYDLVRHVERLPCRASTNPGLPDMRLLACDHVLAFDHASARWYFCTVPWPGADASQRARVWAQTLARVQQPASAITSFIPTTLASHTSDTRYQSQVLQCQQAIADGEIFQVNLSRRLEGDFSGDSFALYRALTRHNPAPFAAYLPGEAYAIASASPERFLQLAGSAVSARPIKGTRPRAADPVEDRLRHDALQASIKDRAENLMIVDLMRNDLGRVARIGSVRVEDLFQIEGHPSVWQMVSTIRAQLREGLGAAELLRACWPPGSMTGAPKVRAMQIIETLEPMQRGPYAGAIGYFDAAGAMDLSVVIRSAVVQDRRVWVQVGGAVVADSDPADELAETEAKGRLLRQALADDSRLPSPLVEVSSRPSP